MGEAARLDREAVLGTLCTVVRKVGSAPRGLGARMIVLRDGGIVGTIGGGALEARIVEMCRQAPPKEPCVVDVDLAADVGMACGGSASILLEPIGRGPRLFVFGGGHIALALVPMATSAGFSVTVIDDRPEYAHADRFPGAATLCRTYDPSGWSGLRLDGDSYAVIVTPGHENDLEVLRALVGRDLAYVGMIGSRAKVDRAIRRLRDEGVAVESLRRVHAPIGLDIGAETPAEIAVSILAELVKIRRQGVG